MKETALFYTFFLQARNKTAGFQIRIWIFIICLVYVMFADWNRRHRYITADVVLELRLYLCIICCVLEGVPAWPC